MAIQTIGGAAATTGLTGTPILQLQRATPAMAGLSFGYEERILEYTLSSPLPSGNYFFTLNRSGQAGTQIILVKADNTVLTTITATGGTTSAVAGVFVPAGQTLTKIVFRKGGNQNASWDTVINVNVVASTDTSSFYGQGKSSANSFRLTIPPIPAGYVKASNLFNTSAPHFTKDGTKTYFVAQLQSCNSLTRTNTSSPNNNFGADHNTNLNSTLKFYEYNIVAGTLTEKAQPVFNSSLTVGLGWNPNSQPGGSGSTFTAVIQHLQYAACTVAGDYVYLDPGVASGYWSGPNFYLMEYPYSEMGLYNISTNTWTAVSSLRNQIYGITQYYGTTTAGNKLVYVPTLYRRTGYNTPNSLNFWQNNWVSYGYVQNAYSYKPGSGWLAASNGRSDTQYLIARAAPSSTVPCTDKYVFIDTYTQDAQPGNPQYQMNIYDTDTGTVTSRYYVGVSNSDGMSSSATNAPYKYMNTNIWFKDSTSTSHVYLKISGLPTIYRMNLDGWINAGTSQYNNDDAYRTRTKWNVEGYDGDYYGINYHPATDRATIVTNNINPNTSATQTSAAFGIDIVPFPTYITP